ISVASLPRVADDEPHSVDVRLPSEMYSLDRRPRRGETDSKRVGDRLRIDANVGILETTSGCREPQVGGVGLNDNEIGRSADVDEGSRSLSRHYRRDANGRQREAECGGLSEEIAA